MLTLLILDLDLAADAKKVPLCNLARAQLERSAAETSSLLVDSGIAIDRVAQLAGQHEELEFAAIEYFGCANDCL